SPPVADALKLTGDGGPVTETDFTIGVVAPAVALIDNVEGVRLNVAGATASDALSGGVVDAPAELKVSMQLYAVFACRPVVLTDAVMPLLGVTPLELLRVNQPHVDAGTIVKLAPEAGLVLVTLIASGAGAAAPTV